MKPEKAERCQIEIFRNMTPTQRLERAFEFYELMRQIHQETIRQGNLSVSKLDRNSSEKNNSRMIQKEVFEKVLKALEIAEIPYMITGSVASTHYGKPRVTYDLDIVVQISFVKAEKFVQLLGSEFYADLMDIQEAIQFLTHFNIIHPSSGLKIDFWPVKDKYDELCFQRRRLGVLGTVHAYFASPEDIILKKLEWVKQGGSVRHLEDIKDILAVQQDKIDREYIINWAEKLELSEFLNEIGLKDK